MSDSSPSQHEIVIIGTGFSGIGMAVRLLQAGIDDFVMLDRATEMGGTWRDNTYPGAACDVPAHLYSLSFEPKADWSRAYARGDEIQAYVLSIVEKHRLRRMAQLGTNVTRLEYQDHSGRWLVHTEADRWQERVAGRSFSKSATAGAAPLEGSVGGAVAPRIFSARLVVMAGGGLNEPAFPAIEGGGEFQGKLMHTAAWDHSYDLSGKRVAVIGTGASAVQVVPGIADQVAQLDVYQRTPGWIFPRNDRAFSEHQKRRFAERPKLRRFVRGATLGVTELMSLGMVWRTPLRSVLERVCHEHRARSVPDRVLRQKLTPTYRLGCKRMLLSDDYYPALCKPQVSLLTEAISQITPHGITDASGVAREYDAIIAATGFNVSVDAPAFPVIGAQGVSLAGVWRDGAEAYLGVSVAGFPNICMLMGPNTGPGHTSVLVYTEAQMQRVLEIYQHLKRSGLKSMDVRPEVQAGFNRALQRRMPYTNWSTGCKSWYLSKTGKNTALWPGFASEYAWRARQFRAGDFTCRF